MSVRLTHANFWLDVKNTRTNMQLFAYIDIFTY